MLGKIRIGMKKRTLAMFMAVCMITSSIGVLPIDADAASRKVVKKLSVSKNYLELEEGESDRIKYKVTATKGTGKAVTIKISDKNIVSAKVKKGKINVVAKEEGETTITVATKAKNKNGKKIAKKIKVTVLSDEAGLDYDYEDDEVYDNDEKDAREKRRITSKNNTENILTQNTVNEMINENTTETTEAINEITAENTVENVIENTKKEITDNTSEENTDNISEVETVRTTEAATDNITVIKENSTSAIDTEKSSGIVVADKTHNNIPQAIISTDEASKDNVNSEIEYLEEEQIPSIVYQAHVENKGWLATVRDGETAGSTGQSKRLEGLKITLNDKNGNSMIKYRAHVEDVGWQEWKTSGQLAGTEGKSKRMEGFKIALTGDYAKKFDIYYRVHVAQFGWLGWAKNGEMAGSEGLSLRMEAIQIKLIKKDESFDVGGRHEIVKPKITYQAHCEDYGWRTVVGEGGTAGTTGQSKRLEGIKINLSNSDGSNGIEYRAHVEDNGWQVWKTSGQLAGTEGISKRMEAIEIKLKGALANDFDIYYRMHVADYGWLGWAKNGETAGTTGGGCRAEALEIKLVYKGGEFERGGAAYKKLTMQPTSKMVNVNWSLINAVGKQPRGSNACGCYAVAYCRTILDGRVRTWGEFDANGGGNVNNTCASWWKAGYNSNFGASELEVFQQLIANINAGKPVVIRVHGTRSKGHYVTVIGYTNVTNTNNLSATNFLITDPGCGAYGAAENLGGVGYTLQNNGSGYQYCTAR